MPRLILSFKILSSFFKSLDISACEDIIFNLTWSGLVNKFCPSGPISSLSSPLIFVEIDISPRLIPIALATLFACSADKTPSEIYAANCVANNCAALSPSFATESLKPLNISLPMSDAKKFVPNWFPPLSYPVLNWFTLVPVSLCFCAIWDAPTFPVSSPTLCICLVPAVTEFTYATCFFVASSIRLFNNKNPPASVAAAATAIPIGFVNIGAIEAIPETAIIPMPKLLLPVINPAIAPIPASPDTGPATDPTLCALCALCSRFKSLAFCFVGCVSLSVASVFEFNAAINCWSCVSATRIFGATLPILNPDPGLATELLISPPSAPIAKLPGPLNPGLGITRPTFNAGKVRVSFLLPPIIGMLVGLGFPVEPVTIDALFFSSIKSSPLLTATFAFFKRLEIVLDPAPPL